MLKLDWGFPGGPAVKNLPANTGDHLWSGKIPHAVCPWDSPGKRTGSGLPCPSPGDLPGPGIEARSPALQGDSLPTEL